MTIFLTQPDFQGKLDFPGHVVFEWINVQSKAVLTLEFKIIRCSADNYAR